MRQKDKQAPQSAEQTVRDIRRATRRHFSAEEKIRIMLDGLRGEDSIAELCRKEGIASKLEQNMHTTIAVAHPRRADLQRVDRRVVRPAGESGQSARTI